MINRKYTSYNAVAQPKVNAARVLIYPEAMKIGAPQLQAQYKCDIRIPQEFDSSFWVTSKTAPKHEKPIMKLLTRPEWTRLSLYWKQKEIEKQPKNELSLWSPGSNVLIKLT